MAHVFFSYSHADEALRNELEKHLAGLCREGVITTWHDRRIGPGDDLHGQIHDQLDSADIVLLLVSSDFLDSNYCYDVEMMRAMQRHERGEARVIPIILRPCDWHGTPFRRAQCSAPRRQTRHQARDARRRVLRSCKGNPPSGGSGRTPASLHPVTRTPPLATPTPHHLVPVRAISGCPASSPTATVTPSSPNRSSTSLVTSRTRSPSSRRETTGLRPISGRSTPTVSRGEPSSPARKRALCGIWLGGRFGTNELYFSFEGVGDASGYNESMSVSDDGYTLLLELLGIAHFGQHTAPRLQWRVRPSIFGTSSSNGSDSRPKFPAAGISWDSADRGTYSTP